MVNININFTNRWLYTFALIIGIFALAVGVYATSHPNPGHPASEIEGVVWTQSGSDIYYDTGNVGIGVVNPSFALDVAKDIRARGLQAGDLRITGSIITDSIETSEFIIRVGQPAIGYVLTSDGAGIGTWQPLPDASSSPSPLGLKQYVGRTSTTYHGANVGGYSGGDSKCAAQFGAGARMSMAADFANGRPNVEGWYNSFISFTIASQDCRGWTSFSALDGGSVWVPSNPQFGTCNIARRILCSK